MSTPESSAPGSRDAPGTRFGRGAALVTLAVLVPLLVAAVVVAGLGVQRMGEAEAAVDARREVVGVAERFVVRFNTYEPGSVDGYTTEMESMLTTSAKTAFGNQVEDIARLIQETDLQSEGEVLASAVAHVDQDDATVLVVADARTTSTAGPTQRHFRWEVDLQRVDGRWLVDDFSPVA